MLTYAGKTIGEMYYGGRKIGEAYLGDRLVYTSVKLPVEVIPDGTSSSHGRNWLRDKLAEYGEHYETVENIPFKIDTSQTTNLGGLFNGCTSLTTVPEIDTSQVTRLSGLFNGCTSLTTVPEMDTSQATSFASMFNGCTSLTTVPDMDVKNATTTSYMFYGCTRLVDGSVRLLLPTTQKPTTYRMIEGTQMSREPFFLYDGTPI